LSRPAPATIARDAVFDPVREQNLHADADAEHRTTVSEAAFDDLVATDRSQPLHARTERTDPGNDQAVGVQRHIEVTGQRDIDADTLERPYRRSHIARPVVEHHDARPRVSAHRLPFVLGTPVSRGSAASAVRRARATALYCASAMW